MKSLSVKGFGIVNDRTDTYLILDVVHMKMSKEEDKAAYTEKLSKATHTNARPSAQALSTIHTDCLKRSVFVGRLCPPTAVQRKIWLGRKAQTPVRACGKIPGRLTARCMTTHQLGLILQDGSRLLVMKG